MAATKMVNMGQLGHKYSLVRRTIKNIVVISAQNDRVRPIEAVILQLAVTTRLL